jgi:hypothetical protein
MHDSYTKVGHHNIGYNLNPIGKYSINCFNLEWHLPALTLLKSSNYFYHMTQLKRF